MRPTVFAQVHNGMDIAREEIFGPVLSILSYADDAEAIALANDSAYGLQAYVFSRDRDRAGRRGRFGQPDPLAPFGGMKQSGLGRESGLFGLESFLEPKAIMSA